MKRTLAHSLMLAATLALPLSAQAQTKDTTALPSGHPALPAGHPTLPSGHPQVGDQQAQLPAGHPQVPGQGQMPAGHPQVPGQGALPSGHPATPQQPAAVPFNASLAVKASQGTKDAPSPVGAAVKVEFYVQTKVAKTVEGVLDNHGVLILENIPLAGPSQALVTVTHDGVPYRSLSQLMSSDTPDQMVRVNVFETTAENPGWQVSMRHIMVERTAMGLVINEMIAVTVPGDRTWIGKVGDDKTASPVTMVIPITKNAAQIALGSGLKSDKITIEDSQIIDRLPLSPGTMQLQLAYVVPVKDGKASVELTAPADIKQLVLFAPDDGSTITAPGLEMGKNMQVGTIKARMYSANNVSTGTKVTLEFAGIPEPTQANATGAAQPDACCDEDHAKTTPAMAQAAPVEEKADSSAKIIAGIGAGVLGAGVAVVLVFKKPQSNEQSDKG